MKTYFISYSYFESRSDEEDDILSYGYKIFKCTGLQQLYDSLYAEIEATGGIMAAVYSITAE